MSDRNTRIKKHQVGADSIEPADLDATAEPTDAQIPLNKTSSGQFEWASLDNFTLVKDGTTLKVADRIENNILLLAFLRAVDEGKIKYNMQDGFVDEYEDESGIDTGTSTNESYNSSDDYYTPSKGANKELDYMEYATNGAAQAAYESSDPDTEGEIDSYTKLLLHGNGINGSKEILDDGNTGHIITQAGTATLSSAQKKLGSTSLLLDGNSDYVTIPDHADWDFGTGDFTLECFIRSASFASSQALYGTEESSGSWLIIIANSTTIRVYYSDLVASKEFTVSSMSINTWYHLAIVRIGNNLMVFLDGVKQGSNQDVTGISYNRSDTIKLGNYTNLYWNGYIDEVRISNIDRSVGSGTSFTVPTAEYTSDANTKLLLHMNTQDLSASSHIPTFVGTAQISTAQKKYGSGAFLFDGNSDYITLSDSNDWDFSNQPFTTDMWIRFSSIAPAQQVLWGQSDASNQHFLRYNGNSVNTIEFNVYESGWVLQFNCSWTPSINTWYHLALVRVNTDNAATGWRIFIDGVSQTLTKTQGNWNSSLSNISSTLCIGDYIIGGGQFFGGYIDELRISQGIARWTTDFDDDLPTEYPEAIIGNLQCYSEGTTKTQGSYSLKVIAKITDSINDTLTKTLTGGSKIDLSGYLSIKLDIYASRTGQNLQLQIHDSGGTTSTYNITVNSANTWETKTWDISGISDANKNDIDSIVIKVNNADAENTFYIDNVYAVGLTNNMTLISNAVTAEAEPSQARIVLFEEDVDSVTVNTDLKAFISIDGTNWDAVTLVDEGDYETSKRILSGVVDVSARTGTSVKYKLTTLNNKDCRVHGVGMAWL